MIELILFFLFLNIQFFIFELLFIHFFYSLIFIKSSEMARPRQEVN